MRNKRGTTGSCRQDRSTVCAAFGAPTPALTLAPALALALCLLGADAVLAKNPIPERLQGMAVSGRALGLIADRVDPDKPLGACAEEPQPYEIRVTLTNVRNSNGNIRLSLYSGVKDEWMAKGMKLIRFDVPAVAGRMSVCMPLPNGPGNYGLGLYHDENADEDYGISSEGYAFSNNAKAGWFGPASFKKAVFPAQAPRTELELKIRY